MTTKPTGLAGLANALKGRGFAKKEKKQARSTGIKANNFDQASDAPIKLMKVSHAMTLIYIALLLAFSIVAVQNNRIRKAHDELLVAHNALYLETQVLRLEAADITSPMAIRTWAGNQGMVPYYSSEMELEQLEPVYYSQQNLTVPTQESVGQ